MENTTKHGSSGEAWHSKKHYTRALRCTRPSKTVTRETSFRLHHTHTHQPTHAHPYTFYQPPAGIHSLRQHQLLPTVVWHYTTHHLLRSPPIQSQSPTPAPCEIFRLGGTCHTCETCEQACKTRTSPRRCDQFLSDTVLLAVTVLLYTGAATFQAVAMRDVALRDGSSCEAHHCLLVLRLQ